MDSFRFDDGHKLCQHRPIRLDRVDAAVWTDVCAVLQNPQMLRQEFEHRLSNNPEPNVNVDQRFFKAKVGCYLVPNPKRRSPLLSVVDGGRGR
jgi:hypothetical protein